MKIQIRNGYFLVPFFILLSLCFNFVNAQTTYTSNASGNWSASGSWDVNGVPPTPLLNGDSIIIKHAITLTANQDVRGVMVVESGGSLTGSSRNLKIGKGAINQGKLINHGSISVDDLEVKPDNGCTVTRILPSAHNYGTITTADKLHIGNNCGAGAFYNYSGAQVFVGGEVHLDNYLWTEDSIFVTGNFKNHGGYAEGGGYIETPYLDIDDNTGRPGTFDFIEVCTSGGTAPTLDAGGTTYTDLNDLNINAPASEVVIDPDSTTVCGFNSNGMSLPVELLFLNLTFQNSIGLNLKWETASELNNQGWNIQRSENNKDWTTIDFVKGAGNSQSVKSYRWVDKYPLYGVESYYRIVQVDYNGSATVSATREADLRLKASKIQLWPNPADETTTLVFSGKPVKRSGAIYIIDQVGKVLYQTNFNDIRLGHKLNLEALKKGIYTVQVVSGNLVSTTRLIKL